MTKSRTESTTDSMTDTAKRAADDLKETGKEAYEGAKSVMGDAISDLRSGATAKADEVREVIAEEGSRMAQSLHDAAGQYGGGVQARVLDTMASGIDSVSRTMANRDAEGLLSDVQSFARRNPALFIAGATVAGIVLVRLASQAGRSAGDSGMGSYGRTGMQAGEMGAGRYARGMGRSGGSGTGRPGGMMGDPVTGPDDGMMGKTDNTVRGDSIPGSGGPSMGGNP